MRNLLLHFQTSRTHETMTNTNTNTATATRNAPFIFDMAPFDGFYSQFFKHTYG